MTSRAVLQRPMAMATTLALLRTWMEQPSVRILQSGPQHLAILQGFCDAGVLAGALITDAHIAALAIENQAVVHSSDSYALPSPHQQPVGRIQAVEGLSIAPQIGVVGFGQAPVGPLDGLGAGPVFQAQQP
jgi:hypothetical protein